jgi:hypothetical protein
MGARTHNLTPQREISLATAAAVANEPIIAQNEALVKQEPPGKPLTLWTSQTYWEFCNNNFLDSFARQHKEAIARQAVQAFLKAAPDAQKELLSMLGLSDYAGLSLAALSTVLSTIGLANFVNLTEDQQNQAFALAGLGVITNG